MVRRIKTSKTLNRFVIKQTRQGILVSSIKVGSDSAQATDANSIHFIKGLANSVTITDLIDPQNTVAPINFGDGVNPTDALDGVGDLPTYTIGKNFFETLTALDSINSKVRGLPLADAADPQDLVSVPDGSTYTLVKGVTETLTASELFVPVASFNRTFTDTPNIVDTPSLGFGMPNVADSASAADAAVVSLGIMRYFSDSITMLDSIDDFVGGSQQNIDFDSASVTESIFLSQGWGRIVSDDLTDDSASVSDVLTRVVAYNPAIADSITPVEAPVFAVGMTLADSATIVDLIGVPDKSTYTLGMNEQDSISSPTDIATFAVGTTYGDIVLMDSDVAALTFSTPKADSATPGELASLGTFKVFTDSVSAIDNEDSSGFSVGSTLPDTVDVVGTGDSASGSMQSYFAAEYVSFTEVYVQDSRHDI